MAGFIFAVGDGDNGGLDGIKKCAEFGVFSTVLKCNPAHPIAFEGTLADYCSLKEGDNIYFFYNRKIYGVGVATKVGNDCKYKNYLKATKLAYRISFTEAKKELLIGKNHSALDEHWICLFKPAPVFYKDGVDMDDLLMYKPQNIKRLRTFWKTSFIKIDDLENDTIKEFLYLRNLESTNKFSFNDFAHKRIEKKANNNYLINSKELMPECLDSSGSFIKHEMALEAILIEELVKGSNCIFGKWDFVTHQLCASPFKPIDYMDRIDIFGYRNKVIVNSKIISKYLIIELKRENADENTVTQLSKYVDYVCKEYAYGDYSLIEAYIVAHDVSSIDVNKKNEICERTYNVGSHPVISKKWNDLHLVEYKINAGEVIFTEKK